MRIINAVALRLGDSLLVTIAFSTTRFPSLRKQIVSGKIRGYLQSGHFSGVEKIIAMLLQRVDTNDSIIVALIQIDITCLEFGFVPTKHKEIFDLSIMTADSKLAKGEMAQTTQFLTSAAVIGFHSVVHLSSTISPLVARDSRYLDAWSASPAVARLHSSSMSTINIRNVYDRANSEISFFTYANSNFLPLLIEQVNLEFGEQAELIDFADEAFIDLPLSIPKQIRFAFESSLSPSLAKEPTISSQVEFIEWGQRTAVLRSRMAKPLKKRIVRIHSYEPFTVFPQLICADGIDLLIFVSEFMKKLTFHVAPHLQAIGSVVIPNAMDLSSFNTNKYESASKTIAMLGYASTAKDPLWALEVVEELNKIQPGWKLILAGADFSQTKKPSEIAYGIEFMKRLASLSDQIELIPFQIDVKEFLQGVGVILSSSVRESFHIAVAEGAASGCLPVVRNWPFFQEFDGARSIYPKDWVVESPRSAAERIVANSELTISQRDDIRSEIVSMYDWSGVKKKYHDAIWG
jgi:hypothetical protein